jgi:long-subunit acyl-CoA synthetase (AMP-forming)
MIAIADGLHIRDILNGAGIFAKHLRDLKIGNGDRVLLSAESRPEWLFAFWGSLLSGAIVVPIGSESSANFAAKVQTIVRPKVIALGEDALKNSEKFLCAGSLHLRSCSIMKAPRSY